MAAYEGTEFSTRRDYPPVFELGAPSKKKVVSVKFEERLLEEIDEAWRSLGYTSRSQFIREAVIYYMLLRRALGNPNLCICQCNETPNAKKLEDILAEELANNNNDKRFYDLDIGEADL